MSVVLQIDEDLRRTRIWHARFLICQVAALVGLRYRLILDIGLLPRRRNGRIRTDPEWHDEARYHAEKTAVVIELMLHQIVQAAGAVRAPRAIHCPGKIAPRC